MSKIWYCPNCGYEVTSRGRCHLCRQRLVASALPELPAGEEDDEVGYRLDGWEDRDRGRLIERLNLDEILHRFEEDELVVAADDESHLDDIVAEIAAHPGEVWAGGDRAEDGYRGGGWGGVATGAAGGAELQGEDADEWVGAAVRLLADAAGRLRRDPTDMHADADVAEASAAVFMVDVFSGADAETWAAVGRVTRRLLSALGADEALEDDIRAQAAVLDKLLAPLVARQEPSRQAGGGALGGPERAVEPPGAGTPPEPVGVEPVGVEPVGVEPVGVGPAPAAEVEPDVEAGGDETVYELPEWLPEQRAQLGILLDDAKIGYQWDGDDLVVPADREAEVESLFEQVGAPSGQDDDEDDGGESRYRAIEELFAAADRLAGDPSDEQRGADVVAWIHEAAGPPPLGLDEMYWFRIMTKARALSESINAGRDEQVIFEEARALRDLLRTVV